MADASISMSSRGEKRRLVVGQPMLNAHIYRLLGALAATLIYFGVGVAFYMPYEGFNFTKCMYFLVQTVTTVGYGDIRPTDNVSRAVTCLFVIVGVLIVAGSFAELIFQMLVSHRDKALKEGLKIDDAIDHEGKSLVITLMDRQIEVKLWASMWMLVEIFVLVLFGVVLMSTVEDWDITDAFYFSVVSLSTVGYGDFVPTTVAGRWVNIIYIITGCFLFLNIAANLSTLPQLYHRREQDRIILSQFDPSIDPDTSHITDPTESLAVRMSNAHMQFTGERVNEETPMIGTNEHEAVELFGRDMVAASDENLKFLQDLCDGRSTISKDEFSVWLLHLMGRIDSSDITVVRHVFDKFAAASGVDKNGKIKFKDVEVVTGSSL